MSYICARCKKPVDIDYELHGIRCPMCGHRILVKERPTQVQSEIKRVKAK